MTTPKTQLPPKDREELWRETVWGWVLQVAGLGIILWYVWHESAEAHDGHETSLIVIGVGVGLLAWGGFKTNKKLSKEWFAEIGKLLRFWKGSE